MRAARLVVIRHGESEANRRRVFAGQTDWRVPNVRELQSIANYQNFNPAVSPAFNTSCTASCTVLTCSCTASGFYWSSSSYAFNPANAWGVDFFSGGVNAPNTSGNLAVPVSLGRTVCIVAHGMTNRIIAGYYLGTLPRVASGNSANTNVTIIETNGRTHRVVKLFDDAHVPEAHEAMEG